jgi:Sigma-70 region 2
MPSGMSDADRIRAARDGDPAALEAMLREHRTQVIRQAMRLCLSPQDAEDATQETLLALSRSIGVLREVAALLVETRPGAAVVEAGGLRGSSSASPRGMMELRRG